MPGIDARLTATLVAVMLGLQAVCWLLAKGLGVRLEKAVDSQDPIPFVRLRMSEPVGRILITWEGR